MDLQAEVRIPRGFPEDLWKFALVIVKIKLLRLSYVVSIPYFQDLHVPPMNATILVYI